MTVQQIEQYSKLTKRYLDRRKDPTKANACITQLEQHKKEQGIEREVNVAWSYEHGFIPA
jgi:hypothetical protein